MVKGFNPSRRAYPISTEVSNKVSNQKGWMVGTNVTYGIGIQANLNRVIAERTTPFNYNANGKLQDDRKLVVCQNTLSGVGEKRSQFNVEADGIVRCRYYLDDDEEEQDVLTQYLQTVYPNGIPPSPLSFITSLNAPNETLTTSLHDLNFLYLGSSSGKKLYQEYFQSPPIINFRINYSLPFAEISQPNWITDKMPALNQCWMPLYYAVDPSTDTGPPNYCSPSNNPPCKILTCAINKYIPNAWNQVYQDHKATGFVNPDGYLEVSNQTGDSKKPPTPVGGIAPWWFYSAIGSGIFIKVTNPLIATNKFHALYLAYGKPYVINIIPDMLGTAFIGAIDPQHWNSYIVPYLESPGVGNGDATEGLFQVLCDPTRFTKANPAVIDQEIWAYSNVASRSIEGTDEALCLLTRQPAPVGCSGCPYSHVIMMSQPNFQGGWCCEIVTDERPEFYHYNNGQYLPCSQLNLKDDWLTCMNCACGGACVPASDICTY